ncbi:MAG: cellulose biosynthesis protein BcsS [Hyphomicrobiaceae bacterium]|nr:cellulose biosynthesis protein BcsS [Hyphomicrobiaceae bacterium]
MLSPFAFLIASPFFAVGAAVAHADVWSTAVASERPISYYEASAGADAVSGSWSAYGGLTAALLGDIRDDGWRVRTSGGYGRYRYARPAFDPFSKRLIWPEFRGEMLFADAMIGYKHTFGRLIVKAYAGLTEEQHLIRPHAPSLLAFDDENAVQGSRRGFKGALETWLDFGNWGFAQIDASWSAPFEAYGSRARLGFRLDATWSAGVEASVFGNLNHDHGRAGAFVRAEWAWGEASVSAGADGDAKDVQGAFGSLGLLLRF